MFLENIGMGLEFVFSHLIFINFILAVIIIFFQRKNPQSVWTWLLLLYFIPILGFIFYLFLGTDMHKAGKGSARNYGLCGFGDV